MRCLLHHAYSLEDNCIVSIIRDGLPPLQLYDPMNCGKPIFRELAAVDLDPKAYVHFAARYGLLTLDPSELKGREPVYLWQNIVLKLRQAVRYGEVLNYSKPASHLEGSLYEDSDGGVWFHSMWSIGPMRHSVEPIPLALRVRPDGSRIKTDDTVGLAKIALQIMVNRELDRKFSCLLNWGLTGAQLEPTTLEGAIWLQFTNWITGLHEYRQCAAPNCDAWFLLTRSGPTKSKTSQRYCPGTACRKAASRHARKLELT